MAFWHHFQPSPLHLKETSQLHHPVTCSLFWAFKNIDPETKQQKAVTPAKLL
jgi:hypothetical protein